MNIHVIAVTALLMLALAASRNAPTLPVFDILLTRNH